MVSPSGSPFLPSPFSLPLLSPKGLILNLRHTICTFLNRRLSAEAFIRPGTLFKRLFRFLFWFEVRISPGGYFPRASQIFGLYMWVWHLSYIIPVGFLQPLIFSLNCFKSLEIHRRARGIAIVVFLDDSVGAGSSLEAAKTSSPLVRSDLVHFGSGINHKKSVWQPSSAFSSFMFHTCSWS